MGSLGSEIRQLLAFGPISKVPPIFLSTGSICKHKPEDSQSELKCMPFHIDASF